MTFSSTGIAYLLLFFALVFLTYRFFQYWKRGKDVTSRYFLYFSISLAVFALVRAITGLFFVSNRQILINSMYLVTFVQGIAAASVASLIIHLRFPGINSRVVFWLVFLFGCGVTLFNIILAPGNPSLEPSGAINWGSSSPGGIYFYYYLLKFGMLLITFVPLIVILLGQFRTAEVFYLKIRSLGLSVVLFLATIISLTDLILVRFLKFGAINRDIITSIVGVFLFITVFLTHKSPEKQGEESALPASGNK